MKPGDFKQRNFIMLYLYILDHLLGYRHILGWLWIVHYRGVWIFFLGFFGLLLVVWVTREFICGLNDSFESRVTPRQRAFSTSCNSLPFSSSKTLCYFGLFLNKNCDSDLFNILLHISFSSSWLSTLQKCIFASVGLHATWFHCQLTINFWFVTLGLENWGIYPI